MTYQVLVDYYDPRAGLWRSASFEKADVEKARELYAIEANRIYRGGIRGVYLTMNGIVVAQSTHEEEH